MTLERGRLADADSAPLEGERVDRVLRRDVVHIEHILSGSLQVPADYRQDHDEWVAMLEGSAELDVDGEAVSLTAGDWILLPRDTPHRVLSTAPGTRWLAVHIADTGVL